MEFATRDLRNISQRNSVLDFASDRRECRVSEIRIVGSEESRSHIPDVRMAQNHIAPYIPKLTSKLQRTHTRDLFSLSLFFSPLLFFFLFSAWMPYFSKLQHPSFVKYSLGEFARDFFKLPPGIGLCVTEAYNFSLRTRSRDRVKNRWWREMRVHYVLYARDRWGTPGAKTSKAGAQSKINFEA